MDVLRQSVYFATVGVYGGLYICNLSILEVDQLLENSFESCFDIKRLSKFKNGVVFTDLGDRKVKFFS